MHLYSRQLHTMLEMIFVLAAFCEILQILAPINRDLIRKTALLRAVTDFGYKVTQLWQNQFKIIQNQQSCVAKNRKTVTAKEKVDNPLWISIPRP